MALQFLIFLIIPVLVPPIVIGIRVQESENLTILAPRGTLFPGEKVQFTCESKEEGILYWHWYRNGSSSPIPVTSISELHDDLEESGVPLRRKTILLVPESGDGITHIGCKLVDKDGQPHRKLEPINIFEGPMQQRTPSSYHPTISLEIFAPPILNDDSPQSHPAERHAPILVTNSSIDLSPEVKSIRLSCNVPSGLSSSSSFEWGISRPVETNKKKEHENVLPSPSPTMYTFILNKLALIYREAINAGRLPKPWGRSKTCQPPKFNYSNNSVSENLEKNEETNSSGKMEFLEVIIPPKSDSSLSEETLTYTCQPRSGRGGVAFVTITFLNPHRGMPPQELSPGDQELLQLIQILMQIVSSSSPSSETPGSSGPLYGMGFGSSTVMVLMALVIYYLRRQLNQLKDQIKENDETRKLMRLRSTSCSSPVVHYHHNTSNQANTCGSGNNDNPNNLL